jgi:hypothetical protein
LNLDILFWYDPRDMISSRPSDLLIYPHYALEMNGLRIKVDV